jgi:FKBP-type peptidyl-prolyl cis-trans isomerase
MAAAMSRSSTILPELVMKIPVNTAPALVLLWLIAGLAMAADVFQTTQQGARYKDLRTGTGASAAAGDVATMHFVGWLDNNGSQGKEIYNSRRAGEPVSFVIGTDRVLPGWNEGITGMRPGGTRLLLLPPALGYGARGVEDVIPPHARLIFIIELLELETQP